MGKRKTSWVASLVALSALLSPFALGEAAADRGVKGVSPGATSDEGPRILPGRNAGTRWAILIGVGRYDEHPAIGNLKYTLADVKGLYEVLTGGGGFPKENVYLMCDDVEGPRDQPRQNRIFARLNATLRLPKREDTVLIYFAGHGIEADGKTYLLPSDATKTALESSGVPLSFLRERLEACAARKKFLILDACHSGQGRADDGNMTQTMDDDIKGMGSAEGTVTLSACRLKQKSFEWEEVGHGVFTYFLMRGLRGEADGDGNKIVGALELSNYVCDRVSRWAADRQMIQTPMLVGEVSGDIALMAASGVVEPPPPKPRSDVGPVVAAAVVLVLLLAGGAVVLTRRRTKEEAPASSASAASRAAKLVVPSLVGPGHKVFVFAQPSLTFGRDSVDRCANDVALRLLPTRRAGDPNYDNTAKIPRVAGMFELRPDGAYLRRLTDKALAIDGEPMAETEQKLHSNSVVSVAGVLALQVKTFRVGAADGPVGALRISRIDNAENHEYVLMQDAISIGSDDAGVVVLANGPKRVGKLVFAGGSFWLTSKPDSGVRVGVRPAAGKRARLAHGDAIEVEGCKILFETVDPDDFKDL